MEGPYEKRGTAKLQDTFNTMKLNPGTGLLFMHSCDYDYPTPYTMHTRLEDPARTFSPGRRPRITYNFSPRSRRQATTRTADSAQQAPAAAARERWARAK
eukprot:scaffold301803_cov49-Tisochrysis_lutea.AAC.1